MTGDPVSNVSSDESAMLIDLLTQQRDLYLQLKSFSDQQAALIAEGHTEKLLEVLTRRQQLVESLNEVNQRLSPYRHRWASVARELPQVRRERLRALVDEVQQLLAGIIDQDEQDRKNLEAAQAGVGRELRQVARTRSVVAAYRGGGTGAGAGASSPPRFTDRHG